MDVTQVIDRLRREQQDLDRQLQWIKERKAQIDTTVSVLQSLGDTVEAAEQREQAVGQTAQSAAPAPQVNPQSATIGRDGGPQALLRRLLQERAGQEFDIQAAYQLLLDDGWASAATNPINVVRSALSSMAERGELLKPRRGIYTYPLDLQKQSDEPDTQGVDTSQYGVVADPTVSGGYAASTPVSPAQDVDLLSVHEDLPGPRSSAATTSAASALSRRLAAAAEAAGNRSA